MIDMLYFFFNIFSKYNITNINIKYIYILNKLKETFGILPKINSILDKNFDRWINLYL